MLHWRRRREIWNVCNVECDHPGTVWFVLIQMYQQYSNGFFFLVEIDLDDVRKEWMQSGGQNQVKTIASHYGIFKDLFGDAFFTPRIPLNVKVININAKIVVCYLLTSCTSFPVSIVRR